jgi:hypothetical protein
MVQQLFEDFKKAGDSGRRKELHNILTELGIGMKLHTGIH